MDIAIDGAGFVERETCYCEKNLPSWWWDGYDWIDYRNDRGSADTDDGYVATCRYCRAELAVFTDPDGTRRPMVRRAGFWRDVALTVAELCASDEITPRAAVNIAVATIVAARDDLNAQETEEATT